MTQSISYMRIIMSVGMIAFVAALGLGATGAFFSDTETSTGNIFTAGSLDLKVDSVGHVNGLVCYEGEWTSETAVQWDETTEQLEVVDDIDTANEAYNAEFPSNVPQAGDDCASTWTETDLGPETFFNFADLKPGDNGENTISLHVYDNDAYACVIIDDMVDNDNGLTEPEEEDGDQTGGDGEGELSQELRFFAWADDGDNIWEPESQNEPMLFSNTDGPASDVIDGVVYPLFTPDNEQVMVGSSTYYIGLYWCYGDISTEGGELSCDGSEVTNVTQTDSLEASLTFYVEQARNNEGFECPVLEEEEGRPVGAALAEYDAPLACNATVSGAASIQSALDTATDGQTVCVADDYDGAGDNVAIRMETANVTLAALVQGTILDVPVVLSADGVTVTGFEGTIGQAESPAEQAAFYFDGDATNARLTYSEVNGAGSGAAVLTETGADNSGGFIENNVFTGAVQGIYLNPHTGSIMIRYNDFSDNVVGIAGLNGALVVANEFTHTTPGSEAIGIDSTFDANPASLTNNNFLNNVMLADYGATPVISAEDNFFSNGGVNQTTAPADFDFTPEALVQFPHN